jgi:hypothetical protein
LLPVELAYLLLGIICGSGESMNDATADVEVGDCVLFSK